MPFRIREVLLVASPFDAYILEEDGLLTEQVFRAYEDLGLPASPRFTHVATGEEAMQKLIERRFDLVITMTRLADTGVNAFGRRVKDLRPGRPVVLLALDPKELHDPGVRIDNQAIDACFVWNGDARILLAIIKHVEDHDNVRHDVKKGNVRVIIIVEDTPRYYSAFLGHLYNELMKHAINLYEEGTDELQRRLYMNSRPKVLHATNFDDGYKLFQLYEKNVHALITDAGIQRQGVYQEEAGLRLAKKIQERVPEMPILVQSSNPHLADKARAMKAVFVDKDSPTLLKKISNFLTTNLGFGTFFFRNEKGDYLNEAKSVRELRRRIDEVPYESIAYHSDHNHFSKWLMARSEFELAEELRPVKRSDFSDEEGLRDHIREVLETAQRGRKGNIADFNRERFDQHLMTRLGRGALGGKARGIAFLYSRLTELGDELGVDMAVRFPRAAMITSEYFDAFMSNELTALAYECDDDDEITRRFLATPLPQPLEDDLRFLLERLTNPLAVRSSSMLEDSLHQPFAGVYTTLMLPNNADDPEQRFQELAAAIRLVYASTFSRNAKSYLKTTGKLVEDEKMGVIIQALVGQQHGQRFYPHFAGVAESYNFYPLGPQKAEDGVVHMALGLGRFVVDGGAAMRFDPKMPGIMPPHPSIKALLNNTQRKFYALDMERPCCDLHADLMTTVRAFDLKDAEDDGTLSPVGSVFSLDDKRVRDDLSLKGPRVVTFNNILRHKAIPLAETMQRILEVAEEGMGGPVEVEFAVDMGDYGKRMRRRQKRRPPTLYILQLRPFGALSRQKETTRLRLKPEECICRTNRGLGHGIGQEIRDIIYVKRKDWQASQNQTIADEVGQLNAELAEENRPYLLIGPGRWGSSDAWLGIPVSWAQISNAKVIVEASPAGYDVEPSQGTHFFQNITSLQLGYLTIPPGATREEPVDGNFIDWTWLDFHPSEEETEHLRHLRLSTPITVSLNGKDGKGLIAKPGVVSLRPENDKPLPMPEDVTAGIMPLASEGFLQPAD